MLPRRRESILKIIVDEYIGTAIPVGSETIALKYGLGVSPATVRNDMAGLEEEGYIRRPHHSAGGLPSDKGYRYFVERILESAKLPSVEKETIRHQFHQIEGSLEQWTRLAASIMTEGVRNAALATFPKSTQSRIKRLELVLLHEYLVLVVLILQQAHVRRQIIPLKDAATQDILTMTANILNSKFGGASLADIRAKESELNPLQQQIIDATQHLMQEEEQRAYEEPYVDGLRYLLAQPEFAESDLARKLVGLLEEGALFRGILPEVLGSEGLKVIIGDENPEEALRNCSFVISNYGIPGAFGGVIGVIGPTRLAYGRAIAMVEYLSTLLSQMSREFQGIAPKEEIN